MHKYLLFLGYIDAHTPKLQSDFCRYKAKLVAEAASRGHITCFCFGKPTNKWHLTTEGLELYNYHKDIYYGQAID